LTIPILPTPVPADFLFSSISSNHDFKLSKSIDDMVQEQVFVGKGGKNMSVGKGKGLGGMSMGMFGVHEGARAQDFGVGTGSGRVSLGQSGMLGTDQHKQPVQTASSEAPAPAPAPASAPAIASAIASDMFVVEPALAQRQPPTIEQGGGASSCGSG
jgi:hypothetical protein